MEYEVDIKLEKQSPIDVELKLETAGITEHNLLSNRDLPDQHPISSITGLQEALDTIPDDYVSDAELESALLEKQDVISDLAQIRSGALLGSTAVQPNDLATALTPYATQSWVENKGYLTEIPAEYVTDSELTAKGYITNAALVGYTTETYVDTGLATKQDTLVSGTNIKTINSQSILGSGNIDIQGGTDIEAFTAAEVQTIWNGVL